MKLCKHLGIPSGEKWIFADPENDAYDRLKLNKGWATMIRPATALRFRDRVLRGGGKQKQGSMDQLFEVLGKWKDAFFMPPKIDQATNHGGTFIVSSSSVTFAHYDEAPGTHADPFEVVDLAIEEAKRNNITR